MSDLSCFSKTFEALTGHDPFPWQEELYRRLIADNDGFPKQCSIPTGLGKTAVIAIWLIALANRPDKLPRRLVYVVNRRTVVDQTTDEVEKVRVNLKTAGLWEGLKQLCAVQNDDPPLAISTLRGQFADNGEWSADPARPAVVVGTVDMIGSRLLFGGYRIWFKSRPLHAGFLGQDALVVHDEAHLEPAFQKLIEAIQREQEEGERTGELPWRKLRVMALTATARRDNHKVENEVLTLGKEDHKHPVVRSRVEATKLLRLHPTPTDKLAERIAELALEYKNSNAAVLIYVRTVGDVRKVCDRLSAKRDGASSGRIQQLTGTMRGYERDRLVESNGVFARFMPASDRSKEVTLTEGTVYLVCTSAGEVGVNLSADHMICDVSTLESMIQRFGRVNRFGGGDAHIDVIYPEQFDKNDKLTPAREATWALLQELNGDASPKALDDLMTRLSDGEQRAAFTPEPTILPATDILFDAWALTTIRDQLPGRPPVEPYLHGVAEWEPLETHVAWRKEVEIISGDLLDRYDPAELLDDYPLKPWELLRDISSRILDELQAIARKHPTKPVWVVDEEGRVATLTLGELADPSVTKSAAKKSLIARIEGRTVLLPPSVGGLSRGMLDRESDLANDVADIEAPETERRIRLWSDEEKGEQITNMRLIRSIDLGQEDEEEGEQRTWDWYKSKPLEDVRSARKPVLWDIHIKDVGCRIDGILAGLSLPADLAQAVRVAGRLHDDGKGREPFQRTLGNRRYPEVVWAKSGREGSRLCEPFRHEFCSLADAPEDAEFKKLSPEMQDVVLHLIAAHHGRARPHFSTDEAVDPEPRGWDMDAIATEVPRRFARLQRKYGRWGLAYLESLLRAADWAASAEPSEFATESREVS